MSPGRPGQTSRLKTELLYHTGFFSKGEDLREKAESPTVPSIAGEPPGLPGEEGREGGPHGP